MSRWIKIRRLATVGQSTRRCRRRRAVADNGALASSLDLKLGCLIWRVVWSGMKRSTRGTHLGHRDRRLGIGVVARLGEADDSVEAPASVRGRRRAGGHTQAEPMASSPPCGALGSLLGGVEAATKEVEGDNSARLPWSSGDGVGGGNTEHRPREVTLACGPSRGEARVRGTARPGLWLESGSVGGKGFNWGPPVGDCGRGRWGKNGEAQGQPPDFQLTGPHGEADRRNCCWAKGHNGVQS
jgi:hypothetical protein